MTYTRTIKKQNYSNWRVHQFSKDDNEKIILTSKIIRMDTREKINLLLERHRFSFEKMSYICGVGRETMYKYMREDELKPATENKIENNFKRYLDDLISDMIG